MIPFFKDYTTQYFLLILMKMLLWDLGFSLTQHCTRNEILFFRSEIAEDWKRYCHSISNLFYKLMPRYAGRRRTSWSSFLFFRFFFCNTLRIASLSDKLVFKLVGGCTVLWAVLCEWNISRHRHIAKPLIRGCWAQSTRHIYNVVPLVPATQRERYRVRLMSNQSICYWSHSCCCNT